MWYPWIALLVSCALVGAEQAEGGGGSGGVATTRAPPRTLDRQAGELAWRTWLQSPEDGNQNAPPRRITTKSLFITPLVCPKGHRLDGTACVQVVTVNKDEHERILLEQLNALFPATPNNGDVLYDYGDEEQGPLQLSIPIGIDPSSPQEPQAQDTQPSYVNVDKKGENTDANVEAELELLKLQQAHARLNSTVPSDGSNIMSNSALHNLLSYSDKPKRDSPLTNSSEVESISIDDEGQKELVFGHVNVDPVLYDTENQNNQDMLPDSETDKSSETLSDIKSAPLADLPNTEPNVNNTDYNNSTETHKSEFSITKKEAEENKQLNPETDYSDIGEAIKLISRYAEVSTDDNFTKDNKANPSMEDSILGTRTKLQYRRNRPKATIRHAEQDNPMSDIGINPKNVVYYRYPWSNESPASPPPNYPFRHLQDYWPGRNQIGGVYNTMHENPRRHHHSYPHYFRPRGFAYGSYPEFHSGLQEAYPGLRRYPHKIAEQNTSPLRSHGNNQDLYSLLGLRHWFSSEGASKR